MPYLASRQDAERSGTLTAEFDGILLDFSRQRATAETFQLLLALAEAAGLKSKIHAMAAGAHLNITEDRAVGHMALRAPAASSAIIDGVDVVPAVHSVLDRIHAFTASIRAGERKGVTGKALTDVVSIGIGGSYLGIRATVDGAPASTRVRRSVPNHQRRGPVRPLSLAPSRRRGKAVVGERRRRPGTPSRPRRPPARARTDR